MSWDALVSTALLGTERRPPRPPEGDGALAAIDWQDAEGALLAAAAVLATARAAGARSPQVPAAEPAPQEELPPCTPEADAVLARVLAEQHDLASEWLERAADARVLPWPRRLPELLSLATYDRPLRGLVLRAGGRRIAWLAAQLGDWRWATADLVDPEAWETGSREERLALLAAVRAEDPAAGRALVESTWDADPPDARRAFLRALEQGLSADDEALLEGAMLDRRKEVRVAAAEMLARLPESARARRMAARLAPLVSVTGTLRRKIEVELPDAVDADLARDGIQEKGAPKGTGPRAWWMRQMVAAAPLGFWREHLGLTPKQVVAMSSGELRAGLRDAVAAQGDPGWAAALGAELGDPDLLEGMPPAAATAVARAILPGLRELFKVVHVMNRTPGPWDAETSGAFLEALGRARNPSHVYPVSGRELHALGLRLDPHLIGEAVAALSAHEDRDIPAYAVDEILAVLDLRHAIHREIP